MKTRKLLCLLMLSCLMPITALSDVWQDPKTKVNYEFITHPQNSPKRGNVLVYAAKIISSPEATGDIEIGYFVMDDDWEMGFHPVTSVDDFAFRDCEGITSVTMNLQSMEKPYSIGMGAFMDCSGLKSVTQLPYGLFDINVCEAAFLGCTSLESVDFLTLKSIGSNAFRDCSSLTSVTLPKSVTSIGSSAFQGCTGLKEVCSEITEPFAIEDNVFSEATYNVPLCVLAGMKAKYEALQGWKNFKNIVEPSNLRIADNDPFISRQKGYPHIEDDANTWCNGFYDFWRKEKHDVIHIYNTKELAVLNDATHLLCWDGAVDLEKILAVHGDHGIKTDVPMDLQQLGLSWKFEVEDYDIKEYDPEAWGSTIYESQYAWLDGNVLKACMTSGGQRDPSRQSKSTIGRQPLLKVQVVDSEGTVKSEGYIKFQIVDLRGLLEVECDVASAQKIISYDDATRGVKYEFGWNEIKEQVFSAINKHGLGISSYEFNSIYCLGVPATSDYYECSIRELDYDGPASLPLQPFVSYDDLWVLPSLYDEIVGAEIPSNYLYGSFVFNKYDSQNREVNNISWTLSDAQAQWMQSHGGTKVALQLYDPNFSGFPEICLVFSVGKQGDVNSDGSVDVADIATIIDVMAQGKNDNKKADVNGDGTVDVADIGAVIDIMAGGGSGDDDEYTMEAASDVLYACAEGDAITTNWNEVEEQILDMLNKHGAMSKTEFEHNYTLDNKVYGLYCLDDQGNWTLPSFEAASYGTIVLNEDNGQFGIQFQGSELMALLSHRTAKGEFADSLGNVAKSLRDRALYPYVDYKVAARLKSSVYHGWPDVLLTFSVRICQNTATMNRPTSDSYGNWYSVEGRYGDNVQFLNANIDPFSTGFAAYAYDVRRMQLNLQENLTGQRWLASDDNRVRAFDFHFDNITGMDAEKRISAKKSNLEQLHGDLYFYTDNWIGDVEEGTPYWHDALNTPTIDDDKFYADRYLIKTCYTNNPLDTVTADKGKLGKYLFAYKFIETESVNDWGYTEITAAPDMASGQLIAYIDNIDTRAFDSGMAPKAELDGDGWLNESVNVHFCWESTFMRDLLNRAGRYAENNSNVQNGYRNATDNPFTTHVHLSLSEDFGGTDAIPVKLTNPDFCIRPLRPLNVEFTTPWDSYSISAVYDAVSGMTVATINYNELSRSEAGRTFPQDWRGFMVKDQAKWIQFYQGKAANGVNTWNATDTYYTFMDNDRSSYNRGSNVNNWNNWYYHPCSNEEYADSWNSMTVVPQVDHMLTNYSGTEDFLHYNVSMMNMQIQHTYDPVTGNIVSTTFTYMNDGMNRGAFDIIIPVTVKYVWGDITTTGRWQSTDDIYRTADRYYHNVNMNYIKVHINTAVGY